MKLPSPKNHAEEVALFRSQIIGALVRRNLDRGQLRNELERLSQVRFRPPRSARTRTFAVSTLERWYYQYRKGGLDALRPKIRSDSGHGKALSHAQKQLICDIRRAHPNASASLILRTLVLDGRIKARQVSVQTVRRLLREQHLDRESLRERGRGHTKVRLRWQAERPNALWHADVCHGPSIGTPKKPLRVHAFMDDASRYIVGIEARHSERERDMLELWLGALRRWGTPDALYLDNGSTYRGNALRTACERLGITLLHAQPYDPQARGGMERFWRTCREGCLDYIPAHATLHDVNARLYAFVDQHYHCAPHGGLMGREPGAVWREAIAGSEPDALDEAALERALTVQERRRVAKDSTLKINGELWQTSAGFLAGHVVEVAYSAVGKSPPWLEYEGRRFELEPVDPVANSRRRRKDIAIEKPSSTPSFDPTGVLLDHACGRQTTKKGNS